MRDVGEAMEPPLAALERAAAEGATGELIFAFEDLEVHVYLQSGRIAWATSSAARFAFARELLARTGIDTDSFRDIVEDCRRERRPLGETLVAWELAGVDDVRTALRLQVVDALETLSSRRGGRTLFLERNRAYQDYDATFTFELEQVRPATDAVAPHPESDADPAEACPDQIRVQRLVDRHPDILWAERVRRDQVTAHAPSGGGPTTFTPELASLTFGDQVDLLVLRCELGAVLGFRPTLDDETSLWLGLAPDTTLGAVQSSLASVLPPPPEEAVGAPHTGHYQTSGTCSSCVVCLERALDESPEVQAAFVLHGADGARCVFRREGFAYERAYALAESRQTILSLAPASTDGAGAAEGSLGFDYRSMLLGQGRLWHFASEVPDASHRRVWLALRRNASQGLGWALLSALARELARTPCGLEEASA